MNIRYMLLIVCFALPGGSGAKADEDVFTVTKAQLQELQKKAYDRGYRAGLNASSGGSVSESVTRQSPSTTLYPIDPALLTDELSKMDAGKFSPEMQKVIREKYKQLSPEGGKQ